MLVLELALVFMGMMEVAALLVRRLILGRYI